MSSSSSGFFASSSSSSQSQTSSQQSGTSGVTTSSTGNKRNREKAFDINDHFRVSIDGKWSCKYCNHSTGLTQPVFRKVHLYQAFNAKHRVQACSVNADTVEELKEAIAAIKEEKEKSDRAKAPKHSAVGGQVGEMFDKQKKPAADIAIQLFLVECGLPPHVLEQESFRHMISQVRIAGTQYKPPRRQSCSMDRSRQGSEATNGLGEVLYACLMSSRERRNNLLQGVSDTGGTLCHDGAKWRKRSLVNAVLLTSKGPFYAQSTCATGKIKTAQWLKNDMVSACDAIGRQNVFNIAADGAGACMAALNLIEEDITMHEIMTNRCSTHGCNLLMADIAAAFTETIEVCVRLVKFIANHEVLYAAFAEIPGSKSLMVAVETRFASQIYSSERILEDRRYLEQFFVSPFVREYFESEHPKEILKQEYDALKEGLIFNLTAWKKLSGFLLVEMPVRVLLRLSDGHDPNLPTLCRQFEVTKRESLEAAENYTAEFGGTLEIPGKGRRAARTVTVSDYVKEMFEKREKDIVTPLVRAAAMVLPAYVYTDQQYVPPDGNDAILRVIRRYYLNIEDQVEATAQLTAFRSRSDVYGQAHMRHIAATRSPDAFWSAVVFELPTGIAGPLLFRKLVNGYAGQGESERMNKAVKKHRNTNRNRQQHEVTAAYLEIDSIQRMIRSQDRPPHTPYLECVRTIIEEIEEETKEEDDERALLLAEAEAEAELHDENKTDNDDDEEEDVVDIGRRTIINMFRYGVTGS